MMKQSGNTKSITLTVNDFLLLSILVCSICCIYVEFQQAKIWGALLKPMHESMGIWVVEIVWFMIWSVLSILIIFKRNKYTYFMLLLMSPFILYNSCKGLWDFIIDKNKYFYLHSNITLYSFIDAVLGFFILTIGIMLIYNNHKKISNYFSTWLHPKKNSIDEMSTQHSKR